MYKLMNRCKKNILIYCVLGVLLAVLVYIGMPYILGKTNLFCQTYKVNYNLENEVLSIHNDMEIEQQFVTPFQYVKEIKLHISNGGVVSDGDVKLELWDKTNNKLIYTIHKDAILIKSDEYIVFGFDDAIVLDSKNTYSFIINTNLKNATDCVNIFTASEQMKQLGDFYINNELNSRGLDFEIMGYNDGYENKQIFMVLLCTLFLVISLMCHRVANRQEFDVVNRLDWFFVIAAIGVCAFLFNQGADMKLTMEHSQDLMTVIKNGKFFDFYSAVLEKSLHGEYLGNGVKDAAFYNILFYLIMLIWMLPFRILVKCIGIEMSDWSFVLYFNVLVILALIYSAYLLYKLALEMKLTRQKSILVSYVYLSSIIVLFSTVGFCQMDIFYMIIVLIALRKYMQQKYIQFSLYMSVAIMLKAFPILIFIPLILLVEKRLLHIIKYCLVGVACTVFNKLLFVGDIGYSYTQEEIGGLYGFVGRIFQNSLSIGLGSCAFFVFIIVVLCIWCFDTDILRESKWKYVVVVPLIAFYTFLIFVLWHPEWFVMIAPFTALAIVVVVEKRSLIYCEWGIGIVFWVASGLSPLNVDNIMVNRGILPIITGHQYSGVRMYEVISKIQYADIMLTSLLVALMAYFCYNSVRGILSIKEEEKQNVKCLHRGLVYIRIASVYLLTLFYVGMYFYLG